jgi:NAD(P)-dependent dehydrogenase (short-subunit alcohol dehydrogenase family)
MGRKIMVVGASRGIGLEMVRQAVAREDTVWGTARDEAGAARISEAGAHALTADVMDERALAEMAAQAPNALDLLVCNAGIYRGRGAIGDADMDAEAWQASMMTNVAGPFLTIRALLEPLEAAKGKVAIISSKMASSELAPGGSYLYRSSKAAVTNVARNLAADLKPKGIAVGSYHPGWVRTDMGGSAADIGVEESAAGLLARFDALSLENTGAFEDWKGEAIPF